MDERAMAATQENEDMTTNELLSRLDKTPIRSGSGNTMDELCVMQRAAVRHAVTHGYIDQVPLKQVITDRPCWANQVLTFTYISVNDWLDDENRQRLRPFEARILACERRSAEVERRINARLLCWLARKVLHLVSDKHREVCEHSIATREAWLRGEATENECAEAAGAAEAAWAAWAAWAAGADLLIDWLDDLLDAWDKAVAEEGAWDDSDAERLVGEFVQAGGS